jgi:hypothetical protein
MTIGCLLAIFYGWASAWFIHWYRCPCMRKSQLPVGTRSNFKWNVVNKKTKQTDWPRDSIQGEGDGTPCAVVNKLWAWLLVK